MKTKKKAAIIKKLKKAIKAAKPNWNKVKNVDKFLSEIK